MKSYLLFGILNSIFGIFIGIIVYLLSIGNGYEIFIVTLPISNFIISFFLWKIIVRKDNFNIFKIIIVTLLSGTLNHYFCFIIDSIIATLGFYINGSFVDSLGGRPANPFEMLTGGLYLSFFSLLLFGWLTLLMSIISAIFTYLFSKFSSKIKS